MTSVCVFTQINIATFTIGPIFLISRSDVHNLRHTTSEPCENVFVNVRRHEREPTVQEFVDIVEKIEREWTTMHERSYVRGRSAEKGYE